MNQAAIQEWFDSQPDLITCPIGDCKMTLRACHRRQAAYPHRSQNNYESSPTKTEEFIICQTVRDEQPCEYYEPHSEKVHKFNRQSFRQRAAKAGKSAGEKSKKRGRPWSTVKQALSEVDVLYNQVMSQLAMERAAKKQRLRGGAHHNRPRISP